MATDRLIFLNAMGGRLWQALWDGPWPPPKRLIVMRGEQSGEIAVVEVEQAPAWVVAAARQLGTITEMRFRLRNASEMPEAAGEDEHWFRGAEYVPDGDDA